MPKLALTAVLATMLALVAGMIALVAAVLAAVTALVATVTTLMAAVAAVMATVIAPMMAAMAVVSATATEGARGDTVFKAFQFEFLFGLLVVRHFSPVFGLRNGPNNKC